MHNLKIKELIEKYPFVEVFFEENNFDISNSKHLSFAEYLHSFSEDEKETLDVIIKNYGDKEPHWLSELVRKEDPWRKTRGSLSIKEPSHVIISKKMILDYYSSLIR